MGVFFRCDGCAGEIPEPAVDARHWLAGDGVPPDRFVWCRLCSREAFRAVAARAGRRPPKVAPGDAAPGVRFSPGRAGPGAGDATQVVPGPDAAGEGVQQVTRWLPRLSRRDPPTG